MAAEGQSIHKEEGNGETEQEVRKSQLQLHGAQRLEILQRALRRHGGTN
jgi:hypothetical protein